jgi:hypothetical protein
MQLQQHDEVLKILQSGPFGPDWNPKAAASEYFRKMDAENACPHDSPEMLKHIAFLGWAKRNGIDTLKTKIVIYGPDQRGLHATVDIQPGEEVLRVPIKAAIGPAQIYEHRLVKPLRAKKSLPPYLAEFIYPTLYVLEESRNPSSPYKLLFDVFPKSATENVMFFSPQAREWLKGSALLRKVGLR